MAQVGVWGNLRIWPDNWCKCLRTVLRSECSVSWTFSGPRSSHRGLHMPSFGARGCAAPRLCAGGTTACPRSTPSRTASRGPGDNKGRRAVWVLATRRSSPSLWLYRITWYFCGPTAAIHIPMLTSSPCNETDSSRYIRGDIISPQVLDLSPGRPSVSPRCRPATGSGHETPRSPSRRRMLGTLDWDTPAPATSRCDRPPSSAWNWTGRQHHFTRCVADDALNTSQP